LIQCFRKPRSLQRMLGEDWRTGRWRAVRQAGNRKLRVGACFTAIIAPGNFCCHQNARWLKTLRVSPPPLWSVAYRALREEGWLDSRQGSGHVVPSSRHDIPEPVCEFRRPVKAMSRESDDGGPLAAPLSGKTSDFSVSRQASIGPLAAQGHPPPQAAGLVRFAC